MAGKKDREDEKRNRKRLEEASLVSRELGSQRITDSDIKKLTARISYEADGYITAARDSEGAFYEPLVLDALYVARAAVNSWKKNENEAAALKYLRISGTTGGIVIPEECGSSPGSGETRERVLGILRESLGVFLFKNDIRAAGDPDAAMADLAGQNPEKKPEGR